MRDHINVHHWKPHNDLVDKWNGKMYSMAWLMNCYIQLSQYSMMMMMILITIYSFDFSIYFEIYSVHLLCGDGD